MYRNERLKGSLTFSEERDIIIYIVPESLPRAEGASGLCTESVRCARSVAATER